MAMTHDDRIRGLVAEIRHHIDGRRLTIASAESLTAGQIATALGAGESASEWFVGGVVAYQRHVKHRVLGVPQGPVVCEEAAVQMARGAAETLGAEMAVAVTGVGGPDEQDGCRVGTVFIAVSTREGDLVNEFHFEGGPEQVVRETTVQALRALSDATRRAID